MADADAPLPDSITFHYLKSPLFRVIHCDGMIGSLTPRGLIHCSIFSERQAIPQSITQALEDGALGKETERVGKKGVVRELEADLMLDLATAKLLQQWLAARVGELESALEQAGKKTGGGA